MFTSVDFANSLKNTIFRDGRLFVKTDYKRVVFTYRVVDKVTYLISLWAEVEFPCTRRIEVTRARDIRNTYSFSVEDSVYYTKEDCPEEFLTIFDELDENLSSGFYSALPDYDNYVYRNLIK